MNLFDKYLEEGNNWDFRLSNASLRIAHRLREIMKESEDNDININMTINKKDWNSMSLYKHFLIDVNQEVVEMLQGEDVKLTLLPNNQINVQIHR